MRSLNRHSMITVTTTTTQTLSDLVDFGLSPRSLRRILWPTTTGSRTQRKRKVNALVRLGYTTPPNGMADELKRDFQIKITQRPAVRARHRKTKPHVVIDEMLAYVSPHP